MKLIFLVFIVLLFPFFNYFIFFITNIHKFIIFGIKDIYKYFHFKMYNNFNGFGRIYLYSASGSQVFGSGKTLSMIRNVFNIYHTYNNKTVYDFDKKKYTTQRIHIISNVELYGIPYIKFTDVSQFIDIEKYNFGSMDIVLYVLDESGAIFNSRQFRDNIGTEMLTRLLQSRKNKCCLFMTSQRLQFTDKLLREILSHVIECKKVWRIVINKYYNPLDLEYALNPSLIKADFMRLWFATDNSFKMYNTYQLVEQLRKEYNPNMYLSTEEILATYGQDNVNPLLSNKLKKGFKKTMSGK